MSHLTHLPPRDVAGHPAPDVPERSAPPEAATTGRHLVAVPAPSRRDDEEGSLVAEYGLLAVVAAVVAGVLMSWANSGALNDFFSALLDHARNIVT